VKRDQGGLPHPVAGCEQMIVLVSHLAATPHGESRVLSEDRSASVMVGSMLDDGGYGKPAVVIQRTAGAVRRFAIVVELPAMFSQNTRPAPRADFSCHWRGAGAVERA